jgi:hypothetical protein
MPPKQTILYTVTENATGKLVTRKSDGVRQEENDSDITFTLEEALRISGHNFERFYIQPAYPPLTPEQEFIRLFDQWFENASGALITDIRSSFLKFLFKEFHGYDMPETLRKEDNATEPNIDGLVVQAQRITELRERAIKGSWSFNQFLEEEDKITMESHNNATEPQTS